MAGSLFNSLRNRPDGLLPVTTYMGYGAGQIGGQILRDTPGLILLFYMTGVIGMQPALAGLVIVIAKVWVVIADPVAGIISDRSNSRWGRRRPFILAGGLVAAACFVLLFFPPAFDDQFALFIYMTTVYIILNTGYSMFSVPYLTMASEMSDNPDERTTIMSFRNGCLAIGLIAGGALAPKIVAWVTQDMGGTAREGYELMAVVLGATIVLSTLWVFFGTANAPQKAATEATMPLSEQIKIAWQNKPFMVLITANIVQYISAGVGYAGGLYFFAYSLQLGLDAYNVLPVWIILISIASIAAMPILVWAAARFGKLPVYKWCLLLFSLSIQLYFFASADSLWIVWLVAICIGLFNGGFILMSFSLLTDTINYDRVTSGISREGVLSSVYSAVDKIGNALGAAIFAAMLAIVGFTESSDGGFPEQSAATVRSITLMYILGPAILHSASIFILNRYKLSAADLRNAASD